MRCRAVQTNVKALRLVQERQRNTKQPERGDAKEVQNVAGTAMPVAGSVAKTVQRLGPRL